MGVLLIFQASRRPEYYHATPGRTRAVAATRQLAKRQMTWLRAMPNIRVLDPYDAQSFVGIRESLFASFERG